MKLHALASYFSVRMFIKRKKAENKQKLEM